MIKNLYVFGLTLLITCLSHLTLPAQLNLSWEEIGPNNAGNHVRGLAVDDNGTVWAGSVGGGLWKSTNSGATWNRVPGVDDNLMVSTIAVDGNKIYVGTGETYFPRPNSQFISFWHHDSLTTLKEGYTTLYGMPGEGVYASTDGGATWD
ncbi:MAG: hypothetical protein AAF570_10320, partial [Bacteroidota bacterium]